MNELTEARKSAEEAIKNGYIEYKGKKLYHRISFYSKHCDSCPINGECSYAISKRCMEYETLLKAKWSLHWCWEQAFLMLTERPHMAVKVPESSIDKIEVYTSSVSFIFNDKCWVNIGLATDVHEEGHWEIQHDPDDEQTYSCGGLWFNGEQVDDYDGCYQLPEPVLTALSFLGYHIDE